MNKDQIWEVLESCILCDEIQNLNEISEKYGFDPKIVKIGSDLFDYLKSIKLEEKENE